MPKKERYLESKVIPKKGFINKLMGRTITIGRYEGDEGWQILGENNG